MEKKLCFMEHLSRSTGWQIGIHRGKRDYYYIVSSKTGTKYYPWVGIVVFGLMLLCTGGVILGFLATAAVLAEFGLKFWPASIGCAVVAFLSGCAIWKLHNLFEIRPDLYKEDYEPTEEELANWDKFVH